MKNNLLSLKKMSILLIEDDEIIQKETAETLNIFFDKVYVANNGYEGFESYEINRPNIVLSDIKMPVMDGLSLTNKIRMGDYLTPIILLTSHSDQKTLLKAVNSGIDGYILKPIELEDMLNTFSKAIKRFTQKKQIITFKNGLVYNMATEEIFINGEPLILGKKEKELLNLFIKKNKTLSKEEIEAHLWPLESITNSALKNLLNRVRSKVGKDLIVSIKGSGWRLNKGVE